jgi:hypothetical protein
LETPEPQAQPEIILAETGLIVLLDRFVSPREVLEEMAVQVQVELRLEVLEA